MDPINPHRSNLQDLFNLFERMVKDIRAIEKAMGDGIKKIIDDEIPIAKKLRSHINFDDQNK